MKGNSMRNLQSSGRARCRVGSDRRHRERREERQATCRGWITAKADVSRKTCGGEARGLRVQNIHILTDAYISLEQTLWRFSTLKLQKNQTDTSVFEKELEAAYNNLQQKKGELTSLGPCPLSNCQYGHATNQIEQIKSIEEEAARFKSKLTDNKLNTISVNQINISNESDENAKSKKNSRSDGFTSPQKVAKKQKILQNYTLGASAPVNINNKFQPIAGSAALSTQDDTAVPVVRPKIPPIHLKFTKNYNLILQEIARKFPKSSSKYSGEYLKIFTSSPDEHRELTNFLQEKGEQYFALEPIANRPQKVVIKGLPIETDVDEIKKDLTDRGFSVIKVAQLTKAKTKFKLPIFMVELKKSQDSPDIFKLETLDIFRTPGNMPLLYPYLNRESLAALPILIDQSVSFLSSQNSQRNSFSRDSTLTLNLTTY
ncbi:nucleic-acid-binding protein from transposon X-element [Trichonephila inaurata madagascariensis]|uniref:Nucleic-acid-binding protein from transposon X-element n=1 Tax=Trichonephila inaurata madagascariensis TaxID=2747483 RepID=A0A8X6XR88_9ARAC|nr:nucleic-acid-binding protein from transposon X-element [Trichonephila inaurata madagascariensis]